jgi:4'-phosphopantetheinyl transferase
MRTVYWLSQRFADVPAGSAWLSEAERSREAGLRVPKRRADWRLGRWSAKRAVLRLRGGGRENDPPLAHLVRVEVRPNVSGAPEAFWDGARVPWALSISHCDGCSLVALGPLDGGIGCDIEAVASRSAAFLEDAFDQSEREAIAASPTPELLATLGWSAKESALKAIGEGLRRPLQGLAVERVAAAGAGSGWRTLELVERGDARRFPGYWRHRQGYVLTIVGVLPSAEPVALS